jgi:hypothetical protein
MPRRSTVVAGLATLLTLAGAHAAYADDPYAGGTGTGTGGQVVVFVPGSSGSPGLPTTGTNPTSGSGSTTPVVCSYYADGNPDTGDLPLVDTSTLKTGDWVWVACYDPGTGDPVGASQRVQWNVGAPPPLQPTAANLAQVALGRLSVPLPALQTWPPNGGTSLVNVPVWLHVGNWTQLTASASAGGLTATITAEPVRATWDMGEDSVECDSAGSSFDPTVPADAQDTSCSYTYRHSSGTRNDWTYHATGTLVWHLRWNATNGQGGDLGEISRTSAFTIRVEESQALVVSAG